jgi:hypothetical protein
MQDERARLESTESAVEGDQLLESAALVEVWFVEAADHDVGDVREAVGSQQVAGGGRRERGERVVAFDAPIGEVVGAVRAERDGTMFGRSDQQPADVRM